MNCPKCGIGVSTNAPNRGDWLCGSYFIQSASCRIRELEDQLSAANASKAQKADLDKLAAVAESKSQVVKMECDEIASLRRQLIAANAKIERLRIACAGYNHTISRIAYLLCQPNEMGWSAYDVSQDELWVIEQVRQLRAERDELLAANAKLDSYLEHTADGALVCETEEFYCPNCGSEVKQNCGICYCWECANPDDGGSPNMPPLPMSYESTYADKSKVPVAIKMKESSDDKA